MSAGSFRPSTGGDIFGFLREKVIGLMDTGNSVMIAGERGL